MRIVPCNQANHLRLGSPWKIKTLQNSVQGLFPLAGYPTTNTSSQFTVKGTIFFLQPPIFQERYNQELSFQVDTKIDIS